MTTIEEYIDLMGKACRLMRDKADKKEIDTTCAQLEIVWNKLDEEEKMYADEQTLRTRLWMGV